VLLNCFFNVIKTIGLFSWNHIMEFSYFAIYGMFINALVMLA